MKKWFKEFKIKNFDADIPLLRKRQKRCEYAGVFYLILYVLFMLFAVFGILTLLQGATVEKPTLYLTTLIIGLSAIINFVLIMSIKYYIVGLDYARDRKYYDIMIYLKEKLP